MTFALLQPVQSTVFVVDVTDEPLPDYLENENGFTPIPENGPRIRVREIYTYVYPAAANGGEEPEDPCRDLAVPSLEGQDRTIAPVDVNGVTYNIVRREVELKYEKVTANNGTVSIEGDSTIRFDNAGLRCMSRACGPAFKLDSCYRRPQVVTKAIISLLSFLSDPFANEANIPYLQEYLSLALGGCYETLFEEPPPASVGSISDPSVRVYYFHTHGMLPNTDDSSTKARDFIAPLLPATPPTESPVPNSERYHNLGLDDAKIRPIFWYPFYDNEAFAFGAITTETRIRLLGRMGALTGGYRFTDEYHWLLFPGLLEQEPLNLTFAQDMLTNGGGKIGEFDAGAIAPGDTDIGLDNNRGIPLYPEGVPFYFGAMPLAMPVVKAKP